MSELGKPQESDLAARLLTECHIVAAEYRPGPKGQRLALANLAQRLDVTICRQMLDGDESGILLANQRIAIGRVTAPTARAQNRGGRYAERFVIAHEMAHVIIHRSHLDIRDDLEEWAANWIARDLLLPLSVVRKSMASAANLSARFGIPRLDVLLQLSRVRRRPPILRWRSQILCAACGEDPVFEGCECRTARENPLTTPAEPERTQRVRDHPQLLEQGVGTPPSHLGLGTPEPRPAQPHSRKATPNPT